MFKRLGAAYGVVKDSGAVEAITRGPGGFLQVMAFPMVLRVRVCPVVPARRVFRRMT